VQPLLQAVQQLRWLPFDRYRIFAFVFAAALRTYFGIWHAMFGL
jgi:hypothetical protein